MSSKFLRGVEIMVWARFLSNYNNRKMKTVLIELSIIRYSPHPFFYAYSVPTHTSTVYYIWATVLMKPIIFNMLPKKMGWKNPAERLPQLLNALNSSFLFS